MDIAAIKQEILNDPAGLGYSGTDEEIAAQMMAPNQVGVVPILGSELVAWSGGGASATVECRQVRILEAAAGTIPATDAKLNAAGVPRKVVRGAAVAASGIFQSPGSTSLDLSKADRRQMLGALVAGQVLTTAEMNELYAMSRGSRAQALGFGIVEGKHVRWARGL